MKKIKKNKTIVKIEILVFALLLVCLIMVGKGLGSKSKDVSIAFEEELEIVEIGKYSGNYMEDGSDEEVSNVMMIKVKNNSDKPLQYAEILLTLEDDIAEFSFSTIPAGETALVLEKNRWEYSKKNEILETELKNVVFFEEGLNLYEDVLEISELEGALNIKNISEKDISGQIAVYYKTVEDEMYQGGITYRALIKDGLKAGEIRQVMTKHFTIDKSEILFVTYVP